MRKALVAIWISVDSHAVFRLSRRSISLHKNHSRSSISLLHGANVAYLCDLSPRPMTEDHNLSLCTFTFEYIQMMTTIQLTVGLKNRVNGIFYRIKRRVPRPRWCKRFCWWIVQTIFDQYFRRSTALYACSAMRCECLIIVVKAALRRGKLFCRKIMHCTTPLKATRKRVTILFSRWKNCDILFPIRTLKLRFDIKSSRSCVHEVPRSSKYWADRTTKFRWRLLRHQRKLQQRAALSNASRLAVSKLN